jgi:ribonuclease R
VPEAHYSHLLELLDQLSFDGTVRRMPGNRFKAKAEALEGGSTWEGVLSMNPRGFGFVTAAGQDDVYVAPDGIGGALHGDRVRVSVLSRTSRGVEGRIEEIVARRSTRVAGVLRKSGKSLWLEPDDTRLRGPIVVHRAPRDARDGLAAIVDITRFPLFGDELPEASLLAVLGMPGDPKVEVAKILVREQVVEEHPEEALAEAERMAARLRRLDHEGRVDLRHVPLPTIDPEDARDHDDALWVEATADGYTAYVAIADVSEYVREGTPLDDEARRRGCTIYLPDRAIPMLPSALAADLCSLVPERDRYCLCVIAQLDKHGRVREFEVVEAIMRSAAMLTYGGVARALGFDPESPQSAQAEAMKSDLSVLDELARKLRKLRMDRGALDLDLPEPRIHVDEKTGAPVDVTRRAVRPGLKRAYSMVEELMLLANELVARWLTTRRVPAIYRVHGTPDEQKLERLAEVAETLGTRVDLNELVEPKGVAKFLKRLEGHPKKQVLETLLLRSLKQAVYDIANVGHFGLASDHYLHFTSPIRRYPDLRVHRQVKALLRGDKPDQSKAAVEDMRAAATESSVRERAAMEVEREVVDLYRALYMRDRVGEVFEGRVGAVTMGGLYVTLDEPFVDVLVRYEALGPDRYEVSDDELSAVGVRSGDKVSLGDRVTVEIEDVAILRRTVYARRIAAEAEAFAAFDEEDRPRRGRLGRLSRDGIRATSDAGRAAALGSRRGGTARGAAERIAAARPAAVVGRGRGRSRAAAEEEPTGRGTGRGRAGARASKTTGGARKAPPQSGGGKGGAKAGARAGSAKSTGSAKGSGSARSAAGRASSKGAPKRAASGRKSGSKKR